jgi:DNA-binding MarR family transcriptional regulator
VQLHFTQLNWQQSKAITMSPTFTPLDSDSTDLLRLDRQLCFALYAASLAMTKLYKPHLDTLGLTYPQYLVMLVLWERDGLSVSDLGARLSLDSGTLTPLLKRLQLAGCIDRRRSQVDERRVEVHLTTTGAAMRDGAAAVPQAISQAAGCSRSEIAALTETLRGLRRTLQAADQTPKPAAPMSALPH